MGRATALAMTMRFAPPYIRHTHTRRLQYTAHAPCPVVSPLPNLLNNVEPPAVAAHVHRTVGEEEDCRGRRGNERGGLLHTTRCVAGGERFASERGREPGLVQSQVGRLSPYEVIPNVH